MELGFIPATSGPPNVIDRGGGHCATELAETRSRGSIYYCKPNATLKPNSEGVRSAARGLAVSPRGLTPFAKNPPCVTAKILKYPGRRGPRMPREASPRGRTQGGGFRHSGKTS